MVGNYGSRPRAGVQGLLLNQIFDRRVKVNETSEWKPPTEASEGEKPCARLPRKGDRVQTSGRGRTAQWPRQTGRVSRRQGNAVFVYWDGGSGLVEDEMDVNEVELLPDGAQETATP